LRSRYLTGGAIVSKKQEPDSPVDSAAGAGAPSIVTSGLGTRTFCLAPQTFALLELLHAQSVEARRLALVYSRM